MNSRAIAALVGGLAVASSAAANDVDLASGQTSVLLDTATLSSVGLNLTGVSADVIGEGSIEGSVAFPINARGAEAPLLPTTLSYEAAEFLGSFSGAIEHVGEVIFNGDTEGEVVVGNFTIGFDAARISAETGASGFFVASTVGLAAPLFDILPTGLGDPASGLTIGAELLVSPELAGVLGNTGLTGVDVGDALVEGVTDCSAADVNDNGFVGFFDLRLFFRGLFFGDPASDFNGDGVFDSDDLGDFIDRYLACRSFRFRH